MPELPDLQVFSRNLQKKLSGKTLEKLTVVNNSQLKVLEKEFKKSLEKQELKKVFREGKELRFEFANGNVMGLHLMLHGDLHLFEKRISAIDDKKSHEEVTAAPESEDDAYELLNRDEQNERAMVRSLLEFGLKEWEPGKTVADYILYEVIDEDMIDNKKLIDIINTYKSWYDANLQPTEKTFLYHEDQQMAMLVMSILEFPYEISEGWKEHFETPVPTREDTYKEEVFSTVNYLRLRKIKRLISMNQKDLEESHTVDEQLTLLQTHKVLKDMEIEMTKRMGTVILK